MKITRFFNTLLIPALALTAHAAMAADPVKIGALYPLSGQVAKSGEDTLNGIRLAVDIINNKTPDVALPFAAGEGLPGLGNAKIELIAADHQGSPEIGAAEAERLITQRKVAALIGAFHSSVAATSSQVAERMGVPYISGESEATNLTGRGFKYFFRTTPTTQTQVKDFFQFLRDRNKGSATPIRTFAVVNENTLWGKEFAQSVHGYASEFPEFKEAIDITYQQGTPDVASEVQRLIAAKPDVVMHASYDAEAILFARTYKQYNFVPQGDHGDRRGVRLGRVPQRARPGFELLPRARPLVARPRRQDAGGGAGRQDVPRALQPRHGRHRRARLHRDDDAGRCDQPRRLHRSGQDPRRPRRHQPARPTS